MFFTRKISALKSTETKAHSDRPSLAMGFLAVLIISAAPVGSYSSVLAQDDVASKQTSASQAAGDTQGEVAANSTSGSISGSTANINAIIERLGARSFREREAATAELLEIGPAALPALRRNQEVDDVELKKRIEIITQRLMNDDFESRVEAFLDGQPEVTLPGWEFFKASVGSRMRHREVFVELSRRHGGAVVLFDGSPEDRREAYSMIVSSFGPILKELNFADAIALLALSADESVQPTMDGDRLIRQLFNYYTVVNASREAEFLQPVQNLMNQWINKVEMSSYSYAITIAANWRLPDGPVLAEKILKSTNSLDLILLTFQLLVIYKDPQHAAMVKPFIDQKVVLDQGFFYTDASGRRLQVRMGDVALATIAKLHQRSLKDLGFPAAREMPDGQFDHATVGFPLGEEGEAARQRVRSDIEQLLEDWENRETKP